MRWLVSRRTPSADPDPPSSTAPFSAVSPEPHSDTESCKSDSPTQTLGRRAGATQKHCPSPSHSLVLGLPHRAQPSRRDPLLRLQRIANAKRTFQTDNSLSKFRVLLKLFFQTFRKLKLSSGGGLKKGIFFMPSDWETPSKPPEQQRLLSDDLEKLLWTFFKRATWQGESGACVPP